MFLGMQDFGFAKEIQFYLTKSARGCGCIPSSSYWHWSNQ